MSGIKHQNTIPNLRKNNSAYVTNYQKAQLFAETFAMTSSDDNYSEMFRENRARFRDDDLQSMNISDDDQSINAEFQYHELRAAIQKCKRKSSPGLDSISYEIIKEIPKTGVKTLLDIFNIIWSNGVLSKSWKHAEINFK